MDASACLPVSVSVSVSDAPASQPLCSVRMHVPGVSRPLRPPAVSGADGSPAAAPRQNSTHLLYGWTFSPGGGRLAPAWAMTGRETAQPVHTQAHTMIPQTVSVSGSDAPLTAVATAIVAATAGQSNCSGSTSGGSHGSSSRAV
jgi:hypothetical protein